MHNNACLYETIEARISNFTDDNHMTVRTVSALAMFVSSKSISGPFLLQHETVNAIRASLERA